MMKKILEFCEEYMLPVALCFFGLVLIGLIFSYTYYAGFVCFTGLCVGGLIGLGYKIYKSGKFKKD